MSYLESLPPPEVVAEEMKSARLERSLLKRLYRLSVEARALRRQEIHVTLDNSKNQRQAVVK